MDADKLNPPSPYGREGGRYVDAMPALLRKGFRPLSTAAVMDAMLDAYDRKKPKDLREWLMEGWHDSYHDTATGRRKYGDRIRIVLEDPLLIGVTPQSKLSNGGLVITPNQFSEDDAHDLTYSDLVQAGIDRPLEKRDVLRSGYAHPGWLALADGDNHRLKNFRDMAFAEGKRRFRHDTMMGFYVLNEDGPSVRSVFLDGVEGGADADDRGHLDGADARLVGVRREVAREAGRAEAPLEARVQSR